VKRALSAWILFAAVLASHSPGQVAVEFAASSQWSGGFVANIRLTNQGTTAVNGWALAFDWGAAMTSHWNATITTTPLASGFRYAAVPASWNSTIAAGATINVGFQANGAFTPNVSGCSVNGIPVNPTYSGTGGGGGGGGGGTGTAPFVAIAGVANTAEAFFPPVGTSTHALSLTNGTSGTTWSVRTNNPKVILPSIVGGTLRIVTRNPGFASMTLTESSTGASRIIGIAVRTPGGAVPRLPQRLAIGSVSEDTTAHLDYWKGYGAGGADDRRFVDIRYIYVNGGPDNGWRTWTNTPGMRVTQYIRESKKLGMIPCFVFYNVPDAGESLFTNTLHLQDPAYMDGYWKDLDLFCDLVRAETTDGWPVMVILEPDCLGYFAQAGYSPTGTQVIPRVDRAYAVLGFDASVILGPTDPVFPNHIRGFVEAVNHIIRRDCPTAIFGWQFNLWASPPGGFTGTPMGGNGICRLTDTWGIDIGRRKIRAEAAAITRWYMDAGVLASNADFVSIDKYGLDAVGQASGAATNPSASPWFFNNDHWQNYLLFVKSLHRTASKPVVLWQMPVGRVNATTTINPTTGTAFPILNNSVAHYEDSASTFFFGDTFVPGSPTRMAWFSSNLGGDPKVSVSGSTVTWGEHLTDTVDAGVVAFLCGPGVGASTTNIPPSNLSQPGATDDGFWMYHVTRFLNRFK
jgi:Cellulose binding domain